MISIDPLIVEFVGNNWLSITLGLTALKYLAKMTKWTIDDTIYGMLSEMFSAVKSKNNKQPKGGK